ncbi:MAG: serine/threonine-protein kinase [Planctomycetota bacterium]
MKWDIENSLKAYEEYLIPGKALEGPFEGWVIQGLLGRGGMALVYLIEQGGDSSRFSGNRSVLKIMPGYLVSEFLVNEYESLKRLQSPHIVRLRTGGESFLPVQGSGICAEIGYLELEYCPGGTLEEYRRSFEGPMPAFYAAKCMVSIFQGLAVAHQSGICHGDICTRNILLDGGETLKISDFGLARVEGQHNKGRQGRVRYFPPEAFGWKTSPANYKWDIWACGIIYLTLIQGVHPLENLEESKCEKTLKSFENLFSHPYIKLPEYYEEALKKQLNLTSDTLEGRLAFTLHQTLCRENRASAEYLCKLTKKALREFTEEGQETLYGEHYHHYFKKNMGKTLQWREPPKISPEQMKGSGNPSEDITYIPS